MEPNLHYLRNCIIISVTFMTFVTAIFSLFRFNSLQERLFYFLVFNGAGIVGTLMGWILARAFKSYLRNAEKIDTFKTSLFSMQEIQAEYVTSTTDVYSYYLQNHDRYSETLRSTKLLNNIIFIFDAICLFFVAMLVIIFVKEYIFFSFLLLVWVLISLCIVVILFPLRFRKMGKKIVEKEYKEINHLIGRHHLTVSVQNIKDVSSAGELIVEWNSVKDIKIIEPNIFITVGLNEFLIIPRRAFFTEKAFTQFGEQINVLYQLSKTN